jgi:hypothetical protein
MPLQVDRDVCYRTAQEHAAGVLSQLPVELGGVLVKSFGEVDRRPKYHNRVNIFPVGYCCEVTIHSQQLDSAVQVEFRVSDGGEAGPLFSAKVLHESMPEEMSSTQLPQLYKKVGHCRAAIDRRFTLLWLTRCCAAARCGVVAIRS